MVYALYVMLRTIITNSFLWHSHGIIYTSNNGQANDDLNFVVFAGLLPYAGAAELGGTSQDYGGDDLHQRVQHAAPFPHHVSRPRRTSPGSITNLSLTTRGYEKKKNK